MTRILFRGTVATSNVMLSHEHYTYGWHEPNIAMAEFAQTTWEKGVKCILDEQLV